MSRRPTDYGTFDHAVVATILSGAWRPRGAHVLDPADTAEVVRRLAARHYSDGQIAYVLGSPRRTVLRIRHRLGLAPGWEGIPEHRRSTAPTRRDRG